MYPRSAPVTARAPALVPPQNMRSKEDIEARVEAWEQEYRAAAEADGCQTVCEENGYHVEQGHGPTLMEGVVERVSGLVIGFGESALNNPARLALVMRLLDDNRYGLPDEERLDAICVRVSGRPVDQEFVLHVRDLTMIDIADQFHFGSFMELGLSRAGRALTEADHAELLEAVMLDLHHDDPDWDVTVVSADAAELLLEIRG